MIKMGQSIRNKSVKSCSVYVAALPPCGIEMAAQSVNPYVSPVILCLFVILVIFHFGFENPIVPVPGHN